MNEAPKEDKLYCIRHSLAHLLATAVLELRPDAKLAFGPPVDDGFYYDFLFDTPLTQDDFPEIEKKMRKIIAEGQEFVGRSVKVDEALKLLAAQPFKVEYCQELAGKGETEIGFYVNGPFQDMCAGPHVKTTREIPPDCFKLDTVAGAYWRGSEKNPQLTRIYGLAFSNKKELNEYIAKRELALQRDHRKLGKELELYTISEQVGPGLALWLPNGTAIREELEALAREREFQYGYQRVATPHITKETLYYTSGHLPYYKDTMFPPMALEGEANYYLKPMNCPHHHMIFSHRPRSYRELPLRLAEYGTVYRYEHSGSLSGLLRVRGLAMNDAHIYCTEAQMRDELRASFKLTLDYYNSFRFENVKMRYSTHDSAKRDKYVDNPAAWSFSEAVVKEVLEELNVPYVLGPGEAAFYGPKIDSQASTVTGREETISTTQLDFAQPDRFALRYVGEDGKEHMPYIIHRAPLGTHERFIAFLIEHFGGAFPTWLAPIQIRIVPVAEAFVGRAEELSAKLRGLLIRSEVDTSSDSFNKKIRAAAMQKIPNVAIIGGKEAEAGTVTLRRYIIKEQVELTHEQLIARLVRLKAERIMDNFADVVV